MRDLTRDRELQQRTLRLNHRRVRDLIGQYLVNSVSARRLKEVAAEFRLVLRELFEIDRGADLKCGQES